MVVRPDVLSLIECPNIFTLPPTHEFMYLTQGREVVSILGLKSKCLNSPAMIVEGGPIWDNDQNFPLFLGTFGVQFSYDYLVL